MPISDFTAGFMCINRSILQKVDLDSIGSSGYSILMELKFILIHDLGARVKEIPIIFKSRRIGESKISHKIISEGLMVPLKLLLRRFKIQKIFNNYER